MVDGVLEGTYIWYCENEPTVRLKFFVHHIKCFVYVWNMFEYRKHGDNIKEVVFNMRIENVTMGDFQSEIVLCFFYCTD